MPQLEVLEHAEVYRNPHPNTTSEYVAFPSILALPSGTLLCQCRHGSTRESDDGIINIHRSTDGGRTWTPGGELPREDAPGFYLPGGFGLTPDNGTIAWLRYPSGRVIAVTNHRRPPYGVRALLSDDGGETFDEQNHLELWGIEPATVRNAPVLAKRRDRVENALEAYHFFTFGTPTVTQVPDGTIVVAFYVTEEHVTYVRCCRLREV
jgi:hypothetical protein